MTKTLEERAEEVDLCITRFHAMIPGTPKPEEVTRVIEPYAMAILISDQADRIKELEERCDYWATLYD